MRYLQRWSILLLVATLLVAGCDRLPSNPLTSGAGSEPGGRPAGDATPTVSPTPDAATLAQELQNGDATRRLALAWDLPERDDLSVDKQVDLLVTALAATTAESSADAASADSYLSDSATTALHLTRRLSELGAEALPALRKAADGASGATREHILIALAYAGDRDVLPEVRNLVTQAQDPAVRMDAARALGEAGDQDARSALEQALQDPFVVNGEDDIGAYTIYPVREQAAAALRALGLTVARLDDGVFEIGD